MKDGGNALAGELSPYLLQHAHNPVDWLPWGEEAFAAARDRDRPILLSIGYSACHWCHVMAHESFEDPRIAELMNAEYVNVKVDREERPDVDAVYMKAVQALTGSGGWPLTAVLTPDGRPFYGGTYFPRVATHGLPAFETVLRGLAEAWRERRGEVESSAAAIASYLAASEAPNRFADGGEPPATQPLAATSLSPGAESSPDRARDVVLDALEADEDRRFGGFGGAPKFPPHALLALLLAAPTDERAAGLARRCLRGMLRGGIRDHLGGGFFRYSVDSGWRVPHFEKMLYDNAQMLANLAAAHVALGGEELMNAADELYAWLRREMTVEVGAGAAFFSALDADSPGPGGRGVEGAYYTWSTEELREVAGDDFRLIAAHLGVGAVGELEGMHVLRLASRVEELSNELALPSAEVQRRLAATRADLLAARDLRQRPAVDDKVLSSWNGLMLRALAIGGSRLGRPTWLDLALANARFLRRELYVEGRLRHAWRDGTTRVEGLLEDYAYVGLGLVELYRATQEAWLLVWAGELADAIEARFVSGAGGYFNTANDAEQLLMRPRGLVDGATPSENAAAAELVWWVGRYRSDPAMQRRAMNAVAGLRDVAIASPHAFASTLSLLDRAERRSHELVVVGAGERAEALLDVWRERRDGDTVVVHVTGPDHPLAALPLLEGRLAPGAAPGEAPRAVAYLCQGGACLLPVTEPSDLRVQLDLTLAGSRGP